ncbi:divalent-cation tolerance protein CutA [Streptomyces sp. NPDC013181]|uniref:divalent-cation tolerance protein CutA n=1 Tax=Streptomyces sp. NPDC013181 TaxID=3364864 RepID=UPI003692D642
MTTTPAWLTVLTTTDSEEKARELARGLVEARLAACVQISAPVTSVYRWQNAIEATEEWQLFCKTTAGRYEELEEHIREAHDYDTPEIIALPVLRGSAGYLGWVAAETAPVTAP